MSKKTKTIPLFAIVLVLLLLVLTLFIIVKNIHKEDVNSPDTNSTEIANTVENNVETNVNEIVTNEVIEPAQEEIGEDSRKFFGNVDILNSRNEYLSAKQCISDYNYLLKMLVYKRYNQLEPGDNADYAKLTLNLLDKSQIELLGINEENIYNYSGNYNFVAQSGYRLIGDYDSASVILFGYRIDLNSNNTEDYGYVVRYDSSSNTYSIFSYEYLVKKELTNLSKGKKIELYNSELTNNGNNVFKYINGNPYDIAGDYLNTFKLNSIYRPDLAFKELNSSYSTKFGNAETFANYINNNQSKLNSIILGGCNKVSSGTNIKFVCQDTNNNTFNIIAEPYDNIFDFKIEFSNIIL